MTFKNLALGALLSAALAFAACGGDDDDSSEPADGGNGGTTPTETPANGGDDANGDDANGDDDGASDGDDNGSDDGGDDNSEGGVEENRAVVVIGDRTYEFDVSIQCLSLFDNMAVNGRAADGSDVSVNIGLPPEDWETDTEEDWDPPYVRVSDDENDLDWRAGGEVVVDMIDEGTSQVDSFTHDGKRASGTATFIDLYAVLRQENPDPVQGTFEFTCPD